MSDIFFSTPIGFGVATDADQVPGGATIITEAAYNILLADATADNAAAAALTPTPDYQPALRPARGAVAFTWDDGWDSHPMVAQMHAERNQKATFYITTGLLDTAQHMTAAQMVALSAGPHEIGCHSATHVDMTTLTPATRATQWASQQTLEGLIGKPVRSYAYPTGASDLACNQEAYGRFDRVAAIGLSQGFTGGSANAAPWLYDPTPTFEGFRHGRFPWNQTTHLQFMRLLKDYVVKRGGLLTAYAHQIGNGDTPTLAQVTEAMDFCAVNGIPCITSAEAFPGQRIVNPGFEFDLDGWTVAKVGAVGTTATVDTPADAPAAGLSGTKSLRIVAPAGMTAGDNVHVFQTIPVRPGAAYSLSARVRHDAGPVGAGKFSVRINEYDRMGAVIAGRSVRGTASGLAWAQSSAAPAVDAVNYVLAGRTEPNAAYMSVGLFVQEFSGTFYADHVYFGPTEEGLLG